MHKLLSTSIGLDTKDLMKESQCFPFPKYVLSPDYKAYHTKNAFGARYD